MKSNTAIWEINCDGYYVYCTNCWCEPREYNLDELPDFCPKCNSKMKKPYKSMNKER